MHIGSLDPGCGMQSASPEPSFFWMNEAMTPEDEADLSNAVKSLSSSFAHFLGSK